MLETSRATQAIIDLEDAAPDVLFERVPGSDLALWPQVRMAFAGALGIEELGDVYIHGVADPWAVRTRLAKALLPSRWDARGFRAHRAVCFVLSGTTVHATDRGARNWLVGDYLDAAAAESVALQWQPLPGPIGAPSFAPTRSLDPLDARADFRAHSHPLSESAEAAIDRLVDAFADHLGVPLAEERIAAIRTSTRRQEMLRPLITAEFTRIVDRISPRVVVMEDASYGHRGALVAAMRERGVLVAEPQHGWIGPSHAAYNYGAALRTPELSRGLPDELLTFGEFWSAQVRHPAVTTALGKPHLESMVESAVPVDRRPREILIASSVADPEATTAFVLAVRDALPPDWLVRFRPHPSERGTADSRYAGLRSQARVVMDPHTDVYQSLGSARAVVGVASTVLYEALAMGCAVFVRRSPFAHHIVGDLFGPPIDGDDGIARIAAFANADGDTAAVEAPAMRMIDEIWKPGAISTYRTWLARKRDPAN